jgi:Ca-activated chloride channel family protein
MASLTVVLGAGVAAAQQEAEQQSGLPEITEGSLVFRSPVSGRYDFVPLAHTDVSIDVRGLVASTTVVQRYANTTDQAIEAVYVFPLPPDAAVYDLQVKVGDRLIKSVIKEREEAKRTYEAAKSEGKRAALLEQERPNIFTASLANLMPGDEIDVRIRYVQPLAWEDGRVRLTFPMVVGPRFIPGEPVAGRQGTGWSHDTGAVPDASRITPPVRHPDSRPGHDISVTVRLHAGLALGEVSSTSHDVQIEKKSDGTALVRLAQAATLPNRDFVLEYSRAERGTAHSALFLSPHPSGDETHFMLVAYPPSIQKDDERPPMETLFLIDVSGSMEGTSTVQARSALLQGLDRLRPGDRFNVVAFSDRFAGFSLEPVPATAANLEAGKRFVRGLRATGGTMMLPALEHLMGMPRAEGFLRMILVLTDGDLGNEEQIFASLRRKLGNARLFTVAIGSAPNHFLATKMAEFGRGSFSHIADVSEIEKQMGQLLDTLESPVLTDVSLRMDGAQVAELYPSRPPDLFLAKPLVLFGRLKGKAAGQLVVEGHSRNTPYREALAFDSSTASFHPGITTLWARQRIEEEMDLWRQSQGEEERARRRAAIVEDAIHYNLVTAFTSLVAVEEKVVNDGDAPRTVAVPTELPAGWSLLAVFGANPATGTADAFLDALGAGLLLFGLLLMAVVAGWVGGRQ